jgi:hypothetical protein
MIWFAARLLDHAARVMPRARRDWIQAMRAELAYIPSPLAALAFALGCVRASYAQRAVDAVSLAVLARSVLAAYALVCAGCYVLATVMMIAIKVTPNLTPQDLGSGPGTAQTLLFFQTYPVSRLAIFPVVAILLAIGAILLARRKPDAFPLLISAAAGALMVAVPDTHAIWGVNWPLALSSDWLIPLACFAPIWWLSRRAPDLKPA